MKTLLFSMIVCVFLTKVTENLDGNITMKISSRDHRSDDVDAIWQTTTGGQHVIHFNRHHCFENTPAKIRNDFLQSLPDKL